MKRFISNVVLFNWLQNTMKSDTSYHKARKSLWDSLVKNIVFNGHEVVDWHTELDDDVYTTLYSFLTAKNDRTQDSAKLAFLVTINSLFANLTLPPSAPGTPPALELPTP